MRAAIEVSRLRTTLRRAKEEVGNLRVEYLHVSLCAECLVPASTDTMQERRVDDQFPKRIDQCHVERREAADVADVDP